MKIKVKPMKQKDLDLNGWGVWTSPVQKFDWEYTDTETCYILEGKVIVHTDDGDVEIKAGDFVQFPSGLKCVWDVKEPIRKYYNFGEYPFPE